jgi:hypothetical protein
MANNPKKNGDPKGEVAHSAELSNQLKQLRQLQDTVRKAAASGLDRTAVAEQIIDEMARRQGHRVGPYFDWSLTTESFESRFNQALSLRPQDQSLQEFVRSFVDAWPQGMAALRLVAQASGPIARPPYSKDGMWPAYLSSRK